MRKSLIFGLTLLGLFDSLYLLWIYTSPSRPMVCLGTGCDAVRASAYAHLWGIPLPAFGVLMYATLTLLVFAEPLWPAVGQRTTAYAVAGISSAGFLFSLYLTYLQGFVIHAWCAWCEVSAIAVTLIAALTVPAALRTLLPLEPAAALARMRVNTALLAAAMLAGIPGFYWLAQHGEEPAPPAPPAVALTEHLVRPDSHATGNPQARLTVVEFGDFQCPYCQQAEEVARKIREKYGDRLRFVFRQLPVVKLHAYAEKAAEASECAAEQGKFWEAVDKFYAGQTDLTIPALKRYAVELGLDARRFNACLDSGAMAARVQRDTDDAYALGIHGTPTFFIGTRLVRGELEYPEFARLVDEELARQGASLAQTPPAPAPAANSSSPAAMKAAPKTPRKSTPASDLSAASPTPAFGSPSGSVFSVFQSAGMACSEEDAAKQQPTLIHTREARELFQGAGKPLFVDVRPARDFASGRIPGAINIPAESFEQRWNSLPNDRTLVLYESGRSTGDICAASRAAGRVLLSHAFALDKVKVFQDGFAAWEKAGLPTER